MVTAFDTAFEVLMGHEGGYSNDPRDRGGETRFGISKSSYPHVDIKALTRDGAKAIYRADFWTPLGCDACDGDLAFNIFDAAVNSGKTAAAKWLQGAVGVARDGSIGPVTLAAVAALPPPLVIARFNGLRLGAMTDFPTWDHHGKGWARRIAFNLRAIRG